MQQLTHVAYMATVFVLPSRNVAHSSYDIFCVRIKMNIEIVALAIVKSYKIEYIYLDPEM